ncbi:MAG: SH3 domain-containing protein [Leptospirales bacterium]
MSQPAQPQKSPGEKGSSSKTSTTPAPSHISFPKGIRNRHDYIMYLQRTIGNQGVERLWNSGWLQKKLNIGPANDKYELEADAVADKVVSMDAPVADSKSDSADKVGNSTPAATPQIARSPVVDSITPLQRETSKEDELQEKEVQQGASLRRKAGTASAESMMAGVPVSKRGIAYQKVGVNLRQEPLSKSTVLERLPQNKKFFVSREIDDWYQVYLDSGQMGYVAAAYVKIDLPEPNANIYFIEKDDYALNIAKQNYDSSIFSWGNDLRFFVNVMEHINGKKGALYKDNPKDDWDKVKVKAGQYIWVPSQEFADTLRGKVGSGSITHDLFSKAQEHGLGGAAEFMMSVGGFHAGLVEGLWLSIWETLVGLKDAAVMIYDFVASIFTGTIIQDLKNLWEALKNLPEAVKAGWKSFKEKWNQPSPLRRWQYRGKIAGQVVGEIALAVLTAGAATALKLVAKGSKFAKFLQTLAPVRKFVATVEKGKNKIAPVLNKLKLKKKPGIKKDIDQPKSKEELEMHEATLRASLEGDDLIKNMKKSESSYLIAKGKKGLQVKHRIKPEKLWELSEKTGVEWAYIDNGFEKIVQSGTRLEVNFKYYPSTTEIIHTHLANPLPSWEDFFFYKQATADFGIPIKKFGIYSKEGYQEYTKVNFLKLAKEGKLKHAGRQDEKNKKKLGY